MVVIAIVISSCPVANTYVYFWFSCIVQNVAQSPKWMLAKLMPVISCACIDCLASNGNSLFQMPKCGNYLNNISSLRQRH